MKIILLCPLIIICSCNFQKNCDSFTIDSSVEEVEHTFEHDVKNPHKMDYKTKLKFDDTIILNGIKVGPTDTLIYGEPTDYYGEPKIFLSYKRYKATEIDIESMYCFY